MNCDWRGLSIFLGIYVLIMLILFFGPYLWYKYVKRLYCPKDKIRCHFLGFYDLGIFGDNDVGHFQCPSCKSLYNKWGDERDLSLYYPESTSEGAS